MAESAASANNKSIAFRGRVENEMPMESKSQNAAMHAAAEGQSTIGIPAKVGKKFIKESHGQSVKKLPKYTDKSKAKRAIKAGMISEKAAKRHLVDY